MFLNFINDIVIHVFEQFIIKSINLYLYANLYVRNSNKPFPAKTDKSVLVLEYFTQFDQKYVKPVKSVLKYLSH